MSGSGYVLTVDESHYLSIRVERVDMLISKMQCISALSTLQRGISGKLVQFLLSKMDKGSQLFNLLCYKMKAPNLSKDPTISLLCVSVCHSCAAVAGCSRCLHDLRCPRVGATATSTHRATWPPDTAAAAETTAAATTRRTMTSIPPRNPTRTQARTCGYTAQLLFNVYFLQDLLCARV